MAWKRDKAFMKESVVDEQELDQALYDASFVLDPASLFDELPQPFRLIDKTVNYVFDKAWDAIQELELRANEFGLGGSLPVYDSVQEIQDFCHVTLTCASLDGKFVFIVAKHGVIYALDTETSCIVASNDEQQGMKVETLCCGLLEENKHLVCILMENG